MTDAVNLLTENDPQAASSAIQLLLLLLAITILPSILILMTSFTRIIIVLSFVRTSLATQQMPPNQVLIGLALFLTFFIMAPTFNEVNEEALQPLFNEEITLDEAYESASIPRSLWPSIQDKKTLHYSWIIAGRKSGNIG